MRHVAAVWLLFAAVAACAGDVVPIRGEVSFAASGIAKILECDTGRVLRVGVMASSPYFRFARRYEELAGDGKTPVLAKLEGVITRSSSSANELTIDHPRIVDLAAGTCGKAPPGSDGAAKPQR